MYGSWQDSRVTLPRLIPPAWPGEPREGSVLPFGGDQARHLRALRLQPGDALEVLLPTGAWKADLAELSKDSARVRLVAPLHEQRESPVPLVACLPITTHLGLWDEWLPPLVELGVTEFRPIAYGRSEYDARKVHGKLDRWRRLILGACEQSHRGRVPDLLDPQPLEALLALALPQKWVAYELATGATNPTLRREALAFTSGPEGGILDEEFSSLRRAGWLPVSLGRSILRAVTTPVALLGAVRFHLND